MLITHHERYWIDDADEAIIREQNQPFEVQTPLEMVVRACFEMAAKSDPCAGAAWWYPVDIFKVVKAHPAYQETHEGASGIGRILTKLGAVKHRTKRGQAYWLKRI